MAAVIEKASNAKTLAIAQARIELREARALVEQAKASGEQTDVAVAESLLIDAMKAYRKLVPIADASVRVAKDAVLPAPKANDAPASVVMPPATEKERLAAVRAVEGRKGVDDPTRLSGTEMRRKAKAETAAVVVAPDVQAAAIRKERQEVAAAAATDKEVGAYLEPAMQALLADQTLRGEALRQNRQLIAWLVEADQHCSNQQPVLARRFIAEVLKDLQITERALKDADAKAAKPATTKKGARKGAR